MVILETGRWVLAGVITVGGFFLLDRVALAWPRMDWSDRIPYVFLLVSIGWGCAYEANQAVHRYTGSKTEVLAAMVALTTWGVLGELYVERRGRELRARRTHDSD